MKKYKHTVYKQKSGLDQFYTSEEIAKECYNKIWSFYDRDNFDLMLEPSAGNGAFFNLFSKNIRQGIDLDPKCDDVIKQDFFEYTPSISGKIIVIGNPPFGRMASLAIKFFNHAATFADVIAFVIPRTFQKQSVQNKLNLNFHLIENTDLPKNSFIFCNEPYNVPCCFQIWEKRNCQRKLIKVIFENRLFDFTNKANADLAVRRVGGRAGKARTTNIKNLSITSHYFLKLKNNVISKNKLAEIINTIDFSKIVNATVGVRSLSKAEFLLALKLVKEIGNVI